MPLLQWGYTVGPHRAASGTNLQETLGGITMLNLGRQDERVEATLEYFDAVRKAEIAWNKFQNEWDVVNAIYKRDCINHSFYWRPPNSVMTDFKYKRNINTRLADEIGETNRAMV
jgi:hypothetical protein